MTHMEAAPKAKGMLRAMMPRMISTIPIVPATHGVRMEKRGSSDDVFSVMVSYLVEGIDTREEMNVRLVSYFLAASDVSFL